MDLSAVLAEVLEGSTWRDSALCAQVDPELFHPTKGVSAAPALRVCMQCPSRTPCLEFALLHGERGVWGATTERERRRLQRSAAEEAAA